MAKRFGPTAAALAQLVFLLSAGLPSNFVRGSFYSHVNEVPSNHVVEAFDGPVGEIRANTLKRKDIPVVTAASSRNTAITSEPLVGQATRVNVRGDIVKGFSKTAPDLAIHSPGLQDSACAGGTSASIFVSSTVFPLMQGCFLAHVVDEGIVYTADTAIIFPVESTSTAEPPKWRAYYESSTDEFTLACSSEESSDEVAAAEATWYCDLQGDGAEFTPAHTELSVSCGCSMASRSARTTASRSLDTAGPTCGEGESFSIESDTLSDTEGCYVDTTELSFVHPVYTASGTLELGEVWVVAAEYTDEEGIATVHWAVANVVSTTSNDGNTFYCFSEAEAALYHPADVPVWKCDTDADDLFDTTADVLSFLCSCSTTPPPAPTPPPFIGSPTPAPYGNRTGSCGEGESFSIASEILPDTEGCYLETPQLHNGIPVYTVSGIKDFGQIWVVAVQMDLDDDSSIIIWMVANVVSTLNGTAEIDTFYCVSGEEAALYHPADVPVWQCETGGDDSLENTAESVVSFSCGCAATPAPSPVTPAPLPSSTDSSSCLEGDSFRISSETLPEVEGCFVDTAELRHLLPVYTTSGTLGAGQFWVVAIEFIDGDTDETVWVVQNVASNTSAFDNDYYCVSRVAADLYHPSEVPVWECDGGVTSTSTALDIAVECGCSNSSSSATPAPATGDEPQAVARTCAGGGSFNVAASAAPELNGCYVDTASSSADGEIFYTASGTMDPTEVFVTAGEDDTGYQFRWIIAKAESNGDVRVYCFSDEFSGNVNPGNASWWCDFVGDSGGFSTTTEEDISIACGVCAEPTEDASPSSKLAVGGVTAAAAGIVVVAVSIGGWC